MTRRAGGCVGRLVSVGTARHHRAVHPDTRYALLGDVRLAYQVVGEGPPDLVMAAGSFSHTDVVWEDAGAELFLRRLAGFSRLIRFDLAGSSGSDRLPPGTPRPTFDDQLDAILDATRTGRFALFAALDAGPGALRYVADHPDRVSALILYNSTARWARAEGYDIGLDQQAVLVLLSMVESNWGTDAFAVANVPSRAGDARFRSWYAKHIRTMGTPTDVIAAVEHALAEDARSALGRITVPTLVIHRRDYRFVPLSQGAYVAEHIPGAELVVLAGADGPPYWETPEVALGHLERFVADRRHAPATDRRLLVLLFTDIVGSTEQLGQLGDRDWSTVLDVHDEISERIAEQHGGRVVARTGDGVLCALPSPSAALQAAAGLRDELASMSIAIRCGLHAGEVEIRGDDVSGLAVHIAARVMAEAAPGEILVSRTVRDLVAGSESRFTEAGVHQLKGISEPWQLYRTEG